MSSRRSDTTMRVLLVSYVQMSNKRATVMSNIDKSETEREKNIGDLRAQTAVFIIHLVWSKKQRVSSQASPNPVSTLR